MARLPSTFHCTFSPLTEYGGSGAPPPPPLPVLRLFDLAPRPCVAGPGGVGADGRCVRSPCPCREQLGYAVISSYIWEVHGLHFKVGAFFDEHLGLSRFLSSSSGGGLIFTGEGQHARNTPALDPSEWEATKVARRLSDSAGGKSWVAVKPRTGTTAAHSKYILLFYRSFCRIALSTNDLFNLGGASAGATYAQDFPAKFAVNARSRKTLDGRGQQSSSFEEALLDYFGKHDRGGVVGDEGGALLHGLLERLAVYDFSSAKVQLVASVPGTWAGGADAPFGHMRLRRLLGARDVQPVRGLVIAQSSSTGSKLDDSFLSEFEASCRGVDAVGASHRLRSSGVGETFGVVWPTLEFIRTSSRGFEGLSSVFASQEDIRAIEKLLRVYDAAGSGRAHAVPHSKLYFSTVPEPDVPGGRELEWLYVGSANFSRAAWGDAPSQGRSAGGTTIKNYELGVLFTPAAFLEGAKREACLLVERFIPQPASFPFPPELSSSSPGDAAAASASDAAMASLPLKSWIQATRCVFFPALLAPQSSYKVRARQVPVEDEDWDLDGPTPLDPRPGELTLYVPFPIFFSVTPRPYRFDSASDAADVPAHDCAFSATPDAGGRRWRWDRTIERLSRPDPYTDAQLAYVEQAWSSPSIGSGL